MIWGNLIKSNPPKSFIMRKSISILLSFLLLSCLFTNLYSQSAKEELDQLELMKQFIGKWVTETGEDSTFIWEIIPNNKGFVHNVLWQAKGETYRTATGIYGFTWENKTVINSVLWTNGIVTTDMGKFVSDKKMKCKRYNPEHNHVTGEYELYFATPDELRGIFRWRGMKETWDDAEVTEYIYTRVKK